MNSRYDNGVLTLFLEGHIDSSNAAKFENEAITELNNYPGAEVILDCDKLEYISSAGLRVVLKIKKLRGASVKLVNVSSEVYEILEVTGFSEMLEIHKKLRSVSVEGCSLLGQGANGKVYRFTPDEMIKVFRTGLTLDVIEEEREASKKAFLLGVPCAIPFDTVRCGDSYGTIYELLKAKTIAERIRENPEELPELAEKSAKLLREMHEIEIPEGNMQRADKMLHETIDALTDDFTVDEIELMHRIYNSIPHMNRFIHNDYHPKNVMVSGGELVLIDLGDSGAGNPIIDIIHSYMVYNLIGADIRAEKPDEICFVGITYAEAERFWKIFSRVYWGSEEKSKEMDEKVAPFATMMYLTVSMAHPRLPKEYHPVYVDRVRKNVFPHAEKMLKAFE